VTQQVGAHKVKVGTKFELLAKALLAVVLMSTSTLVLALDPYLIQPGDVLEISVWREDGLQREALVRPDGGLSFPLVGEIGAAGQTVPAVSEEIKKRLTKFIPDPVVTVALKQNLGNKVYVIGKVNRPGEFAVNRAVDVLQALSMAGGMNPFADTKNIQVLRRVNGEQTSVGFNYAEMEQGKKLQQNILLQAGDVVVVP
jgi:polysaccharide export outer membrane protein